MTSTIKIVRSSLRVEVTMYLTSRPMPRGRQKRNPVEKQHRNRFRKKKPTRPMKLVRKQFPQPLRQMQMLVRQSQLRNLLRCTRRRNRRDIDHCCRSHYHKCVNVVHRQRCDSENQSSIQTSRISETHVRIILLA